MILTSDVSPDESACAVSETLAKGKLVIIPTDTIYGISGIVPTSEKAIFACKGRDEGKPFIRLLADPSHLALFTKTKVPSALLSLWPSSITFIVRGVLGETVAYRCPGDEWLRKIIKLVGYPIYSTSVNHAGEPSMTKIADIIKNFSDSVDLIVDKGDSANCVPSTIVDVSGEKPRLIRKGAVTIPSSIELLE